MATIAELDSEDGFVSDYNAFAGDEIFDYDLATVVGVAIYEVLLETISRNVAMETGDDGPVKFTDRMRQKMVSRIISFNLDRMEDSLYMSTGADGRLYLCGRWLNRGVYSDGKIIPMKKHLKKLFEHADIVYLPGESGASLRKKIWYSPREHFESFNLPRNSSVDTFRERISAAEIRRVMKESMKARMKSKIRNAIKNLLHKKS